MKKIVITGGSSGLGLALTQKFLALGCQVICLSRRKPELSDDNLIHVPTDLTSDDGLETAIQLIVNEHSDVDVLINNAGVIWCGAPMNIDEKDVEQIFQVNIQAMIKLTSRLLQILEKNEGDIVNIGSTASVGANKDLSLYTASKWAVRGYTKSLQTEYKQSKLRIIGVYPGGMNTPLFDDVDYKGDVSTYMDKHDIAETILFALKTPRTVQLSELLINRKPK